MKIRTYTAGPTNSTAIQALDLALRRELPAFRVLRSYFGCFSTRIEIAADDSTPDHAFARIPGFGVPGLTLQEVKREDG